MLTVKDIWNEIDMFAAETQGETFDIIYEIAGTLVGESADVRITPDGDAFLDVETGPGTRQSFAEFYEGAEAGWPRSERISPVYALVHGMFYTDSFGEMGSASLGNRLIDGEWRTVLSLS